VKGWGANRDARARLANIPVDVAKLAHHVELGRCCVAGMLIFDDEGYFHQSDFAREWPDGVWLLYVGRWALEQRGLIAEDA
jgi:hypothetical protein